MYSIAPIIGAQVLRKIQETSSKNQKTKSNYEKKENTNDIGRNIAGKVR
jgi:hypothetical protein